MSSVFAIFVVTVLNLVPAEVNESGGLQMLLSGPAKVSYGFWWDTYRGPLSVKLHMGEACSNVTWGEKHKYASSSEISGAQFMSAPEAIIRPADTAYRDSTNDYWPDMDELKAISEVYSLGYDADEGYSEAYPILNGTIEVALD